MIPFFLNSFSTISIPELYNMIFTVAIPSSFTYTIFVFRMMNRKKKLEKKRKNIPNEWFCGVGKYKSENTQTIFQYEHTAHPYRICVYKM